MSLEKKPHAEDILASNNPYRTEDLSPSEQVLAASILNTLKASGNETLSGEAKSSIWENIKNNTVLPEKRIGLSFWVKIAASIILVTGFVVWQIRGSQVERMKDLAAIPVKNNTHQETRLILSGEQSIALNKDVSISYQNGFINQTDSSRSVNSVIPKQEEDAFNKIIVPYGRRSQLTLDDGTTVWLNSGSQLVYPVVFAGKSREVYLRGEAYFDVSHKQDIPFYVHTDATRIKVLGTEFNVSSYPDDRSNSITLVEGSVEISIPDGWFRKRQQKLEPGDRAVYASEENRFELSKVETQSYVSWKYGYLQLNRMPLDEILKSLSRYHNIQITKDVRVNGAETFSGRLDLKTSIPDIMKVLCAGTNYTYDEKERRLVVRK